MSMRVSDNYISNLLVGDLNNALARLLNKQRQAGNMRRILSFADDPRAVAAMQRYSSLVASNDQYLRNVSRSRMFVDATDSALQEVSGVLMDVRELVMFESSGLSTERSRNNAAIDVDSLMDRLLSTLNTTVEGNYIFSGHRTDTAAFVRSSGSVIYQGDAGEIVTQTGPGTDMTINIAGDVFLGTRNATLVGRADLAPRISPTTPLADLSLGSGWEPGSIEIQDGSGTSWIVDLSAATTVADIEAEVAAATGGAVTLSVSADGGALEISGVEPLVVSEVDEGTTASSLGIRGTSTAGTLTGRDVRPALTAATDLTAIEALAGNLPLGSIEVTVNQVTTTVDFSTATTMGDLQAILAGAVPGLQINIQATHLDVVSSSPEPFTVVSSGGDGTASLLGIEGTGSPVRLFGMLEDLKTALEANDTQRIRSTLTELAAVEETVYGELVRTGGRQRDLDWIDGVLRQRDERLQTNLSLERDADVAQVTTDLSRAETIYQASLLVTSKLFDSNLMMFLR